VRIRRKTSSHKVHLLGSEGKGEILFRKGGKSDRDRAEKGGILVGRETVQAGEDGQYEGRLVPKREGTSQFTLGGERR